MNSDQKAGARFALLARPQQLPGQVIETILAIIGSGELSPGDWLPAPRPWGAPQPGAGSLVRSAG